MIICSYRGKALLIQSDRELSRLEQIMLLIFSMKLLQQQSSESAEGCSAGKLRLCSDISRGDDQRGPLEWPPLERRGGALFLAPCVCGCRRSSHGRWSGPTPGGITNPPNLGLRQGWKWRPPLGRWQGGRISIIPATMKKTQRCQKLKKKEAQL